MTLRLRCTVNGNPLEVNTTPMARILDVLREELELTGTKEGCGEGECGACTVLIDGDPVCACLVPAVQCDGAELQTIEGVAEDHPIVLAFADEGAAQCGICTPGMVMTALTIPHGHSSDEIRRDLVGNLCRCTGYEAIIRAIRTAHRTAKNDPRSPSARDAR